MKAPTAGPSHSTGAAAEPHRVVTASVRKKTTGSPSTYEAKGIAADGNGVYLEVRSSSSGFSTLTSGTLVNYTQSTTGEVSMSFNATSGTRYLVVVYPANGSLWTTCTRSSWKRCRDRLIGEQRSPVKKQSSRGRIPSCSASSRPASAPRAAAHWQRHTW